MIKLLFFSCLWLVFIQLITIMDKRSVLDVEGGTEAMSSRFKDKNGKKGGKKKKAPETDGPMNRADLEEMMAKTLKKQKSRDKKGEKMVAYIVSEGGLVENDESPRDPLFVPKRKEYKSLLDSVTEIEDTKRRLAEEPGKRVKDKRHQSEYPSPGSASESRRGSITTIASVSEANKSFKNLLMKRRTTMPGESSASSFLKTQKKASFQKKLGAWVFVTKAIGIMMRPRQRRKKMVRKYYLDFFLFATSEQSVVSQGFYRQSKIH